MDLDQLKIERKTRLRPRGGRRRPWFPVVVVLLLVAGGVLFRRPLLEGLDRLRLPKVRVVRVERSHPAAVGAIRGKAANGYVVAARRAALSADTPGRIVEVNVEEGSIVHQGDVVARLYAEEYAAALRRAQADLLVTERTVNRARVDTEAATAERRRAEQAAAANEADRLAVEAQEELTRLEHERVTRLVAEGVLSTRDEDQARTEHQEAAARLQAAMARVAEAGLAVQAASLREQSALELLHVAEAQVESAQATVEQARATLDKTEVRAPFDGIVVLKDAEVGEVVSPNSQGGSNARGSVCTMVDFASLEAQADVPETSIAAVTEGAAARIFLDAWPDTPYAGVVSRIWPTANRQKATIEVRVRFEEPDERLRPEMGVRIVFEEPDTAPLAAGDAEPVLLLPMSAVVALAGQSGVFLVERDEVRFQPVGTGMQRSGRVVIESGLVGGERVVVDPPASLGDGDRIQVVSR